MHNLERFADEVLPGQMVSEWMDNIREMWDYSELDVGEVLSLKVWCKCEQNGKMIWLKI